MSVLLQCSRVVVVVKAMPNPSQKYGETYAVQVSLLMANGSGNRQRRSDRPSLGSSGVELVI